MIRLYDDVINNVCSAQSCGADRPCALPVQDGWSLPTQASESNQASPSLFYRQLSGVTMGIQPTFLLHPRAPVYDLSQSAYSLHFLLHPKAPEFLISRMPPPPRLPTSPRSSHRPLLAQLPEGAGVEHTSVATRCVGLREKGANLKRDPPK